MKETKHGDSLRWKIKLAKGSEVIPIKIAYESCVKSSTVWLFNIAMENHHFG